MWFVSVCLAASFCLALRTVCFIHQNWDFKKTRAHKTCLECIFFSVVFSYETGSCWVHHWCAVWSEGVEQTEGEVLINVDKAVISGIQRVRLRALNLVNLALWQAN